jgi:catechol 2,3-dioxygenase-like lactoylglutathione lyase family enzyme
VTKWIEEVFDPWPAISPILSSMPQTSPPLIPEFKVTDLKKSLDFYTDLAQFVIEYDRPEQSFAMLTKEGAYLMIEAPTPGSRTFDAAETVYPFGRGMHLQIKVADVQRLYDNFKDHNYPLFLDMEEKWYRRNTEEAGNKQFLVQDPDGYLLRFYEDLGVRPVEG